MSIKFSLTETTDQLNVSVFNMSGQEVAKINNIRGNNENYAVIWGATDNNVLFLPASTN